MKSLFRYITALILIAIVLTLTMDRLVMPLYVRQGSSNILPNVVGLSYPEAAKVLRRHGFRATKGAVAHTQKYPPNQVFEMHPQAYSRVKKGRIILLTVTEEEKMVGVPELVGESLRSAEISLARVGLEVDTVMTRYSDNYESGIVMWQFPQGGNLLRRGTGLSLMVSKGEAPLSFFVPSVVGLGFQAGRREILDAGLEVGHVRLLYAPNLLPNTIIDQSIPGGTVLKVKRAVNLTVSTYEQGQDS